MLKGPEAIPAWVSWRPKPGTNAAISDAGGMYRDVYVRKLSGRRNWARVCELPDIDNETVGFDTQLNMLHPPLVPDIQTRFNYMDTLIEIAIRGGIKALFVTGEGGIGKSYSVQNLLDREELEEGKDYFLIKGHASPRATFNMFRDHPESTFIFDDCDSVLRHPQTENIMKAVLDAWSKVRRVSWVTTGAHKETTRYFEFTGVVIFISNMERRKVDEALLSRCVVMDMEMTVEEKIERLEGMLPNIKSDLRVTDRRKVLEVIKTYRYNVKALNIRTLLKAFDIFKETDGNLDLVRYQILQ